MFQDIDGFALWLLAALAAGVTSGRTAFARSVRVGGIDVWITWGVVAFFAFMLVAAVAVPAAHFTLSVAFAAAMAVACEIGWLSAAALDGMFGRGAVMARTAADVVAADRQAAASASITAPVAAAPVAVAPVAAPAVAAPAVVAASPSPAAAAAAAQATADQPGAKPPGTSAAGGAVDDLKLIRGIGPANERALNALDIHHLAQIAGWSADDATWVGGQLSVPGRIAREHWIAQARLLAAGLDTPYSAGVKSGAIVVDAAADAPLSEAEAAALAASLPAVVDQVAGEDKHEGTRPLGLAGARAGQPDNLRRIKGIGPQNEARLHALGIWHYDQIAAWTPENVLWVGSYLAFPGRIDREGWIAQARALAAE